MNSYVIYACSPVNYLYPNNPVILPSTIASLES
jgi:hypothetical protein